MDPTLLILGIFLIVFGFPIVFLIFFFRHGDKRRPNPSDVVREREVIVKEIVLIPCQYCGGFMPQTSTFCPNCGAKRIA